MGQVNSRRGLIFALLLVGGCQSAPDGATNGTKSSAKSTTNEAECVSKAVIERMRDSLFDSAIAAAKEGTQNLNSLRSVLSGRIESPLLQAHDDALKRTSCSGRLVFALPPNTHRAFAGATSLSGEIAYDIQPAADQSGPVVKMTGGEPIVDALVNAVRSRKAPERVARAAPVDRGFAGFAFDPPEVTERSNPVPEMASIQGPSFSCGGKLNRVERMICDDGSLADQDRALNSAWRDARSRTSDARKPALEAERQKYLARRNACRDSLCIATTYDEWIAAMYSWGNEGLGL